jgi:hypothetical protein
MKKINKNDIFINEVTYYPKYEWYAPIESNCLFLNNQKNIMILLVKAAAR